MNPSSCSHRPTMVGRGADGGCGTEEKPCSIYRPPPPRLPSAQTQTLDPLHFYTQAQKALSERSPFDPENALSRVSTLPACLSAILSRCTDRRRRKQWKSHSETGSKDSRQRPTRNVWDETEEYFRHVTLADIERLLLKPVADSCFFVPLLPASVGEGNVASAETATEATDGTCANVVEVGCLESVDAIKKAKNGVEQMEIDSVGPAGALLSKEPGSLTSLHWLLGCRHKILLTSERPSKKRKLMGGDAGLERLVVAQSLQAGNSALCHVCCSGENGEKSNVLLSCNSCNVSVHQKCYGVRDGLVERWLCSWCKQRDSVESCLKPCLLCPKEGGALKPLATHAGRRAKGSRLKFAHLFCSMWMPELYVEDMELMEPILNVAGIKDTRRRLLCFLCKVKYGVCIRCSNGTCRTSFHPICAREAKLRMEIWGKFGCNNVELRAFCSKHSGSEDTGTAQHSENSMCATGGGDSLVANPLPMIVPVNRLIKLKLGCRNVDKNMLNSVIKDGNRGKGRKKEVQEQQSTVPLRLKSGDTHLILDTDMPRVIENNSTGDANISSNSIDPVPIPNELIDQGKTNVRDAASEMGISTDLLSVALVDCLNSSSHLDTGVEHGNEQVQNILQTLNSHDEGPANMTKNISEKQEQIQRTVEKESLVSYENTHTGVNVTMRTSTIKSNWEHPDCAIQSTLDLKKGELASTSYIHPFINKKLMQMKKCGFFQLKNRIPYCDGLKEKVMSSMKQTYCIHQPWNSTCTDLKCRRGAARGEQLVKARMTEVLDLSPEDEVEGEIVYFQSRLLDNAVANKHHFEYLIFRVVSNLPHELDALRKQRWDAVVIDQFLREVREAKKQGRKERRHKEAQAVFAAATAAAAASSRISSQRKDLHDETPTVVNTVRGRAGRYSQVISRAKETLSGLAVSKFSSEPVEVFQLTSDFPKKDHSRSCDICRRNETVLNQILVCCNCKVAVHLGCYNGLKDPVGPWYCEVCEELTLQSSSPRTLPVNTRESSCFITQCGICGGTTGAFRKSTDGQWIHAFCAEWVLESTFRRGQPDPVGGMEAISKQKDLLVCCICRRKHGVCIKCGHDGCQTAFHPNCAKSAGLYMNVKNAGGKLHHKAYCGNHSLEQKKKSESQQHGPDELRSIKQIRVELEKLRLLCDRIIKREKLKRELIICSHDVLASKRDNVAFSMLVRSSFFPPDRSSDSVTTSLKGHPDDNKSCSDTQRSDDVTIDSTVSGTSQVTLPVHMDIDWKTGGSFTSQPSTCESTGRVPLSGKQLPCRAISIATQNSTDDGEKRSKSRKHTETFQKELIMTSDQASLRNLRLPKGYVYIPVGSLPKENPVSHDMEAPELLDPDG